MAEPLAAYPVQGVRILMIIGTDISAIKTRTNMILNVLIFEFEDFWILSITFLPCFLSEFTKSSQSTF